MIDLYQRAEPVAGVDRVVRQLPTANPATAFLGYEELREVGPHPALEVSACHVA